MPSDSPATIMMARELEHSEENLNRESPVMMHIDTNLIACCGRRGRRGGGGGNNNFYPPASHCSEPRLYYDCQYC